MGRIERSLGCGCPDMTRRQRSVPVSKPNSARSTLGSIEGFGVRTPTPIDESGFQPRRKRRTPDLQALTVVACSDCHAQDIRVLLEYVRGLDSKPDFLLYAGDAIERFRPSPATNHLAELAKLTRYGVGAVLGNDDPSPAKRRIAGERVYDLHVRPVRLGRYWFVGSQGAPEVPGGISMSGNVIPEELIEHHLETRIPLLVGRGFDQPLPVCILCSHAPPFGMADRSIRYGEGHIGSTALTRMLFNEDRRRALRLVLCGHAHLSGGQVEEWGGTTVVNIASHDGDEDPLRVAFIRLQGRDVQSVRVVSLRPRWPPWGRTGLPPNYWESHNLSRLRGIGQTREEILYRAGILGLYELAEIDQTKLQSLRDALSAGEQELVQLPVRARALLERRVIPLTRFRPPPGNRIYIDVETDLKQSWIWLIGCYDEREGKLRQFGVRQVGERFEREALEAFTAYAADRPDAVWCSYSNCALEERLVQGRLRHFGLPPLSTSIIDLYQQFHASIAVPDDAGGIKALAAGLGYKFRHPHLDGIVVASRYLAALGSVNDPIAPELLEYNADDVLSLYHVSRRLSELDPSASRGT